ncbi:Radical SAM domain protein [Ruminococcus albus 7 = DSM 20455]|uniref:Radical SAM domain protein n=1 Tax=Ruminococcus albus (strain ATCC 27210 / DSM 20455 / JCM 14654 / NCDO 2250 / 7) TaxID=697329 RepID=E6UIX8_RUMA7|nr:radical SAM protein [Ruminococcus albus]ADU22244.1 Radical SAM domain protein [Ruminococcus albus 7 = DSM 20455]
MISKELLKSCKLCPRKCGAERFAGKLGFCRAGAEIKIARADLHMWEEPPISGTNGSGTVFFSGCNLQCCFCQNHVISAEGKGFVLTAKELADTFLMLQDRGAHNINLVTAATYVPQIIEALDIAGDKLNIPIVYNSGGYENIETLEMLRGYVDIFLPDLKYYSGELSSDYSGASDYFGCASRSLIKMHELVGSPKFDENGIMKRGVIVRHLVLPSCRHDSAKIIGWLADNFTPNEILISLMSQYTPMYKAKDIEALSRRTSTFEYEYVCRLVEGCGFDGFFQQRSAAEDKYVPEFFDKKYY